jgi:hypothetical protein
MRVRSVFFTDVKALIFTNGCQRGVRGATDHPCRGADRCGTVKNSAWSNLVKTDLSTVHTKGVISEVLDSMLDQASR